MTLTPERLRRPIEKLGDERQLTKLSEEGGEFIHADAKFDWEEGEFSEVEKEGADVLLLIEQFRSTNHFGKIFALAHEELQLSMDLCSYYVERPRAAVADMIHKIETSDIAHTQQIELAVSMARAYVSLRTYLKEAVKDGTIDRIMEEKLARLEKKNRWGQYAPLLTKEEIGKRVVLSDGVHGEIFDSGHTGQGVYSIRRDNMPNRHIYVNDNGKRVTYSCHKIGCFFALVHNGVFIEEFEQK